MSDTIIIPSGAKIQLKRNYFAPFDNMTNVASNTDLCDLDSFVVNGSKCRVRLSETHLIVEQQPSPCYVFGKKKPLVSSTALPQSANQFSLYRTAKSHWRPFLLSVD